MTTPTGTFNIHKFGMLLIATTALVAMPFTIDFSSGGFSGSSAYAKGNGGVWRRRWWRRGGNGGAAAMGLAAAVAAGGNGGGGNAGASGAGIGSGNGERRWKCTWRKSKFRSRQQLSLECF